MIKRNATTLWKGSGKEGKGNVSVESGIFTEAPMAYGTRFKDDVGTNPEELIGAAHSACFSMALSFKLGEAGFTPDSIETKCIVSFEDGEVVNSHLNVSASVEGIEKSEFEKVVSDAAANCPISMLLQCKITHDAKLSTK
ncbi:MAG: osmotically inducible protein OsmC [Saprospiraceae bacterium]|mgnify:CR=1 FL=1|jgi:osmotically inducible protein OsmC|tara:strand:+ start:96 stop:515 length:420 start_codon:yes stop_codon:yes gene_type:complete